MSKVHEKREAIELRKQGWSIKDIASKLSVSKGSVSTWCGQISLTKEQQVNLKQKQVAAGHAGRMRGAEVNRQKRLDMIEQCRLSARKELGQISHRDLLLLGIGLYWGEGVKSQSSGASLVNSDATLLLLAKRWFENCLGVCPSDFRPYVYLSKTHEPRADEVIWYWSRILDIPREQFKGPFYTSSQTKRVYEKTNTYNGVLALRVCKSTNLKYRIQGLIDACTD